MEVKENNGLKYYLDDIASDLAKRYDTNKITGPQELTGNYGEECAVWPLLLVAYNTGKYWGVDFKGYGQVIEFFSDVDRVNMMFAKGRVRSEQDLDHIAAKGHLRKVEHNGTSVYFVSDSLAAKATNYNPNR